MSDAMLHVLIPTDFSPCAQSALRYALEWSRKLPVTAHIFHKVKGADDDWRETLTTTDGIEQKAPLVSDEIKKWVASFAEARARVVIRLAGGKIADEVIHYIQDSEIDLIFMGTRGRHKEQGESLGSNAIAVLSSIELPVLIAKESVGDFEMNEVVFASSFDKRAKLAFPHILKFIRPFAPELHLLNIETPRFITSTRFITASAMADFKDLAHDFKVVTHFHKDKQVGKGIVAFCDRVGADLIAFSESSQSVFGGRKMAKEVQYLVEHAIQPIFFVHHIDESQ